MSEKILRILGLDTLLFRDGRPFSNEPGAFSARTLTVPLPGTIAGFLRTRLGNRMKGAWNPDKSAEVLKIPVSGPILHLNSSPMFHTPADALIYCDEKGGNKGKVMCLRPIPMKELDGTNIPDGMRPMDVLEDVKPEPDYNLWTWQDMQKWLLYSYGTTFPVPTKIQGLPIEERVHVEISDVGTSEEGKLFSAQFLSFEHHIWKADEKKHDKWSLIARIETERDDLTGVGQLGGENRSAIVELAEAGHWPPCPDDLKKKLESAKLVRMVLATPAVFACGWKPGWLAPNLTGSPPSASSCKLKLIAAAIKRREPVSGWDYLKRGPKAVRWMVPAGSVYFFEVEGNSDMPVQDLWLKSVSDELSQDGYGLALWGIWNDNNQEK
ncbi:MAG: type III-B CRISPR module-associated protein Cmr3 [Bacteroidetes bacterium]|nr:type III-B CRISPR module-associated protein Cmr3 [Bacteroidota bacterium]MCW5897540.1 type III-B CRISPR module-associated protein Cmr3 [Bacteroidota bacterium]